MEHWRSNWRGYSEVREEIEEKRRAGSQKGLKEIVKRAVTTANAPRRRLLHGESEQRETGQAKEAQRQQYNF